MHLRFPVLATALLLPVTCMGQPSLTVTNRGAECFQPVIEVPDPPEGAAALRAPSGLLSPVQPVGERRSLVLVPALLGPGETLVLRAHDGPPPATDLAVETTDKTITVRNTFLGVVFPRVGNGGLPAAVEYPLSGHVERDFQWMDRLYDRERGFFNLRDDADATASVVEEGPLQVTVEARGRFVQGDTAPGDNSAVYRWTFRAHSPVVEFSASVEREDDFRWPELHVLQVSRKDDRLKNWAGESAEVQSGRLLDDNTGRSFSRWGALDDGENAVGLAWDGKHVSMYDGRSSYVYYLQYVAPFAEESFDLTGRLYFGPALSPGRYREEIMQRAEVEASWSVPAAPDRAYSADVLTLADDTLALAFDRETFGCLRIRDVQRDHDFLRPPGLSPTTWGINLRGPEGETLTLDSNAQATRGRELAAGGRALSLRWSGIAVGDEQDALDVTVRVELPAGADRAYWHIEVDNRSETWSIMEVDFPKLANISEPRHASLAVARGNWGNLYEEFTEQRGRYPSANWPMQFVSLHEDGTGLYLGYEDPGAWPKYMLCRAGQEFHFRTPAQDATRPGNDFRSPGPFALGVAGPGWWDAAKMYRQWALQQQWTSEGPLVTRASTPEAVKNLGLWFLGGGAGEQVVADMRRAAEFFGVPIGIHWYNWHRHAFDTHYPEYFPAKPDFKPALDALVPEGMLIMPYINGRIVDKSVEAYQQYIPFAARRPDGDTYTEVYGNGVPQAPMCPATEFWQDTVADICETLIGEYGVNAIYIDQVAAAGAALCYDPTHGHPLGGGSWWVDGYREMLRKVQHAAKRDGRDVVITTENNAEPYMDGVDCFLVWNPRYPEEIPMMNAVYSGYTIYFASNARCEPGLQPYAMIQGREFIWGSQLGWMGFAEAAPSERGNYLREVVRLRHAALKYVIYGELLGELEPLNDVGTVTGKWRDRRPEPFDATLPAVMSTVWRGSDDTLGVFIVNLSDQHRTFSYALDAERFGPLGGEGDCLLLTDIRKEGSVPCGFSASGDLRRTEFLAPWEARVVELRRVPSADAVEVAEDLRESAHARRFTLEAWAAEAGVEWEVTLPPAEAVERDVTAARVRVKPGTTAPRAYVDFGEGHRTFSQLNPDPDDPGWQQAAVPVTIPPDLRPGDVLRAEVRVDFGEGRELEVPFEVRIVRPLEVALAPPPGGLRAGEPVALTLTLTNNREGPAPAGSRVLIDAPAEWDVWPGRTLTFGPLGAKQQAPRLIRVRLPREAATGPAPVRAYVLQAEDRHILDVAEPRAEVPAARLTPTIDGDLGEWAALDAIELGPAHAGNIPDHGGPADLAARAWLAHDDDYLYFAADVTDDVHSQENRHAAMWQGDAIQLAFRPGNPPRAPTYDRVIELGLALTSDGPELWQWMPAEGVVTEGSVVVVREGQQTRYEAAIPWSAVPDIRPVPGAVAAFSMTVNECDGEGFRGWLELTPGICGGKDASHFARLVF